MRDALSARGWEVRFGTDARPEEIAWVTRDPLIRLILRDIKRRWRIEIHPASKSPAFEMARLHPHGWIDGDTFRIGLTSDPQPHVLGHELMHLLLYERGYPDSVPFRDGEVLARDQISILLCGLLDIEVDRQLGALGFDVETDAIEHAKHAIEGELPPNLTPLDHALLGFARLRSLPDGELRTDFIRWAEQTHGGAFSIAKQLDRVLPTSLSPEDVTVGILMVADGLGIDPGFMPAPMTIRSREDVPGWRDHIRSCARQLNAPVAAVDQLTDGWATRPIRKDDWPVLLPLNTAPPRSGGRGRGNGRRLDDA
jgi:hypothetical protein